jgi:uncharacterized membrane protein YidH (DUF202 family)
MSTRGQAPAPGVAPERTVLAWTRTTLSYGVCVLLCLRLSRGSPALLGAVGTVGAVTTAAVAVAARSRRRRLAAAVRPGPAPVQAATAAGLTILLAAAAAALVVLR